MMNIPQIKLFEPLVEMVPTHRHSIYEMGSQVDKASGWEPIIDIIVGGSPTSKRSPNSCSLRFSLAKFDLKATVFCPVMADFTAFANYPVFLQNSSKYNRKF